MPEKSPALTPKIMSVSAFALEEYTGKAYIFCSVVSEC